MTRVQEGIGFAPDKFLQGRSIACALRCTGLALRATQRTDNFRSDDNTI
jgi:hypothetical protein